MIKMRRIILGIVLQCCFTWILSSCRPVLQEVVPVITEDSERIQIGISFDSFLIERWVRDRDVFVSTAQDLGAEVNIQNANGNVEEQIKMLQYFIEKQVDVIVIIANEHEPLTDVVREARKNGIKIICYDRFLPHVETDLFISFDSEEVGRLMAKALTDSLTEEDEIFMIKGSPTDHNVSEMDAGFFEVMGKTGIEVVYSAYCVNWLGEKAYVAVSKGLDRYPEVAGIMCGNDDLANNAFRSLSENRLAGDVFLIGQDADLAACQRIVEGTQLMTVYKPVEELAKLAAEYAVRLAEGEELELAHSQTTEDGIEVPYLAITPVAVTKDNIDEVIIDSGFHTRDEVYLNIQQ